MPSEITSDSPKSPRLLNRLRTALRVRHYSRHTETAYVAWTKRFIFFHEVRHPKEMGPVEVNAFLSHLAVAERVSPSTQNQALSALLFLYRHVLHRPLGDLGGVIRARRPRRRPIVLTRDEVKAVLDQLCGDIFVVCSLLYGGGLRLMESLRLRVQDLDFAAREVLIRDGKGGKDRVTVLPGSLVEPLQQHLAGVKTTHEQDVADGWGRVELPYALARKYRHAAREWCCNGYSRSVVAG